MNLNQIKKEVKKNLSKERYFHSKCVMHKCASLAKKYGADIDKAKKVGIAHDIAKEMTKDEQLEYIKKYNIYLDKYEQDIPKLWHAKIGADITNKMFGFDREMTDAVSAHTTAKENMSLLAKILYISDLIGNDRKFPDVGYVRKLANNDIDEAIIYCLDRNIKDKEYKKEKIHQDSILAKEYLLNNKSERNNQI